MRSFLCLILLSTHAFGKEICYPDCSSGICTFNFQVRLTAGQLGYFEVDGCEGSNPTLGMELNVTHHFLQKHPLNYYHPLGFAYFPDGDHDEKEELEPGIPPPLSDSDCASSLTCPAPIYMLNENRLGSYSNDPNVAAQSSDEEDFGLDLYEPMFFYPYDQWLSQGVFSIYLRFDQVYDKDIFYFCHIHQYMTGRIKLLQGNKTIQSDSDLPEIPYQYDVPSEFDESCGSFALSDFQLPNAQCPERFVCDAQDSEISMFASCIEAQNCHMFMGMTTGVSAKSVEALFYHQMIPHHENAVNMAKTLLTLGNLQCNEFDEENPDCIMYQIGVSIVNNQNYQIQKMRELITSHGFPDADDCIVPVSGTVTDAEKLGRRIEIVNSSKGNMARSSGSQRKQSMVTDHQSLRNDGQVEKFGFERNREGHTRRRINTGTTDICTSETGRFTVRVNLFAGALGYFTVDECGDTINPTIGMEINTAYTFDQTDRTNYYHPLGFAYFPDGDHADFDELEPGIIPPGTSSNCAGNTTCPAPMYFQNGQYLGDYNNDPDFLTLSSGKSNFGLKDYEPLFFRPLPEWAVSNFSVSLRFDEGNFQQDFFYFCHIHEFMSGRIKLLKNGIPINEKNEPEIAYDYDVPGSFDETCGTFGLDSYQLPNNQCFPRFVCDIPEDDANLKMYSHCIEAMNCRMLAWMTTKATSNSGIALFIHHMVPHHQNAINMAKATLTFGDIDCNDLTQETDDCLLETILREIINAQNREIQQMYHVLEMKKFPKTDDCVVDIKLPEKEATSGTAEQKTYLISKILLFIIAVATMM